MDIRKALTSCQGRKATQLHAGACQVSQLTEQCGIIAHEPPILAGVAIGQSVPCTRPSTFQPSGVDDLDSAASQSSCASQDMLIDTS